MKYIIIAPSAFHKNKFILALAVSIGAGLVIVVPFADVPGLVTGFRHGAGPGCQPGPNLPPEVHHPVAETAAPGQDLGPARGADRVAASRLQEGGSPPDQAIQVRGLNNPVAQCMDGVWPLIIRDKEQYIGLGPSRHRCNSRQKQADQEA